MSLSISQWLEEVKINLQQGQIQPSEISAIAFHIIQDLEQQGLNPFDLCVLGEVFAFPLTKFLAMARPIAAIASTLVRLFHRKKPLKRSEGTWLAIQIAYINAVLKIIEQELNLNRPWLDRAKIVFDEYQDQRLSRLKLQALIKTICPERISDFDAEEALTLKGDSTLVKLINEVAISWFMYNSTEETEAKLLVNRIIYRLPGELLEVIMANSLPLAQLQKFVRLGNLGNLQEHSLASLSSMDTSIDEPREKYRASLLNQLSEPFLGEYFALSDLYIHPKGNSLPNYWETVVAQETTIDLQEWINAQLEDPSSIVIVEGDTGLGKTTFCQYYAAWIAQNLYPRWMPVYINLREVSLGKTFEETLDSAFPRGRFRDSDGWLSQDMMPILFLLDGLTDIPPSPQWSRSPELVFLDQVVQFHHQQLQIRKENTHKIILTRTLSHREISHQESLLTQRIYQGYNRKYRPHSSRPIAPKLQRISLQHWDQNQLRQWFEQWSNVQTKQISQNYFNFLKRQGIFTKAKKGEASAQWCILPLNLYILGLLHRDGLIQNDIFNLAVNELKLEIGERITCWLLGQPLTGSNLLPELVREGLAHASRTPEAIANLLGEKSPTQSRNLFQNLAFDVFQTPHWQDQITPENVQNQQLPALFLQQKEGKITFSNAQLGFYWVAKAIAEQLQLITHHTLTSYGEIHWDLESPEAVAKHLYSLLGSHLLLPELLELIFEHLKQAEKRNPRDFSLPILFERLDNFYQSYCQGRWLDQGITSQIFTHTHAFNTLQIEANVGLNIFLFLCLISHRRKIPFYPCGNPQKVEEFDANRFLLWLNRTALLSPLNILKKLPYGLQKIKLVGACLNHIVLTEMDLEGANLAMAELIDANLIGINLQRANLSYAHLAKANLKNANLSQANLEGADLSGANLQGVNFYDTNLKDTCLFEAQLDPGIREMAFLKGAIFSWEEFQLYNQSLMSGSLITDVTGVEIFETPEGGAIQSVAGIPILPSAWDSYNAEEDTQSETLAYHPQEGQNQPINYSENDDDDSETLLFDNYSVGMNMSSDLAALDTLDDNDDEDDTTLWAT